MAGQSVHSKAIALGYPFITGIGKRMGDVWLVRFTKTEDEHSPFIFLGWKRGTGWVVNREEKQSEAGNPPFKKPYRVETWFERDRKSIVVYDADDREIAEWWDDDVDGMVDSGYFDDSGFIMGREVRKGRLEDSVLAYVKEMGLDMPAGLDRAAKMRRVAAKRRDKKNWPQEMSWWDKYKALMTGKHDEENPPHWGYTMGELAAATRHLKSLQLHFTPEEIEHETGIAPQIQSSMLRGGSVYSGAPEALSKMFHQKVSKNNPDTDPRNLRKYGIEVLRVQELPGTGMVTGTRVHYHLLKPAKNAKQIEAIILNRFPYGMKVVSHYSLRPEAYPGVKHAYGILLKGKTTKKNPPLPASALMDISTAKTVVREVDSGVRPPRPALSQADDLLDRGLQKLRGSHLGHVDWSNPPAHKDDVVARHQIKIAKDTLKMSDVGARIMGGMTKEEARAILSKYGIKNSYEENPPATEVYKNIVEIKAVKPDGQRYIHKFEPGSHILGLPNGDLLVQSRKGKRLWKNFKMEG